MRRKVDLKTYEDVLNFIEEIKSQEVSYVVENTNGSYRVAATSSLGLIYAVSEFEELFVCEL